MARLRDAERQYAGVLDDLRKDILSMVGPMHYLQVAPVCRAWNKEYRRLFRETDKLTSLRSVTASVPLLQWAVSQGCLGRCHYHSPGHTDKAYTTVVHFAKWSMVGCATCGAKALRHAAAFTARLDVLERVLGVDHPACAPPDERTCAYAALGGQMALLRALRARGCPWDVFTTRFAARAGHLHVLQWARAHGCPWDVVASWCAAAHGHVHVLRWAAANGCALNAVTCQCAAQSGQLHALQWLRAQGCAWDASAAEAAARVGDLECLQWAVRQGCPWDAKKCHEVATSRELRTWIRRQRRDVRHAQAAAP